MNKCKVLFNLPRLIPHLLYYTLCKGKRDIINSDIMARPPYRGKDNKSRFHAWKLCCTLIDAAEFRNVFYMRAGLAGHLFNVFLPKIKSMRLSTHIGEGFCPIHSYSTIINGAATIGRNCTVYHCVTIGVERSGVPTIGDNVTIGSGAIILGGIHIGDNVNIGAGAIVVENVPNNSTVVGPKARIIPHN